MNRKPKLLAMLACLALVAPAAARADDDEEPPADDGKPKEMKGAKDHPAVKRYPGAVLHDEYLEKEYEEMKFPVGEDKWETAAGKYYQAGYKFPKKSSCTLIIRNYENAFKAAGMKTFTGPGAMLQSTELLNGEDKWVTGIGTAKNGGKMYVIQTCVDWDEQPVGHLVVVETKNMEQKVEVTSDFMADEIERNGHIALYGITFATGKADISAESGKLLGEIGKLLSSKPAWKLRIEGHTDNVGNARNNLELSKKRAAAVKDYLVKQNGIEASRITTDGFGDTRPISDNKTEDGRSKNRRVELVKL